MPTKQEIAGFIRATFRSVWALELLCFLRQNRDRTLAHAEMVAELRGSDLVVTQSVEALAAAGLIVNEAGGDARYAPASDELEGYVAQHESLYGSSPDAVRRMIVAAATRGLTAFVDAFRLRKD